MTGPPVTEPPVTEPPVTEPPVIELHGVGVHHPGRTRAALDPLDLRIWPGELICLTGQAGSGRTTLLHVLGLLTRPTSGRYLLSGLDTARLGDKSMAALRGRLIGSVFQPPHLIGPVSALDNVMLPLRYGGPGRRMGLARPSRRDDTRWRRALALEMLSRVGLAGQARVPAGQLSAAEQRLVAIARALACGPDLLLCDDPTASLDQAAAARVIGLLADLAADGRTVVTASSEQLAAARSSRCVPIGPRRAVRP